MVIEQSRRLGLRHVEQLGHERAIGIGVGDNAHLGDYG
jgi:hypothetical protein